MTMSTSDCVVETCVNEDRQVPERDRAASSNTTRVAEPPRGLVIAFVLLCLLGLGVSIELSRIHVFVHTDPSYHSVCAMSEGVNCETVAASPYSVFAGLPVAVWGVLGYLLMGALALWSVTRRLHSTWPWGILVALSVFSAVVSVVLAFISATRIDSICVFCTASYVINGTLLVISLLIGKRSGLGAWDRLTLDIEALVSRPVIVLILAVGGLTSVGLLEKFVPAYWKAPGWDELPELPVGIDADGHHWIGAKQPIVTIVEFSDYECPHCRAAHKNVRALVAKYPARVRLVHRHLPLDMACHPGLSRPFHAHACRFAEAAECAGLQGQFWEMNDALFSVQDTTKSFDVEPVELAVRLGLDRSKFSRCLSSHAARKRVSRDVADSMALRLNGTPSFLIGDRLYLGRVPAPQLERLLRKTDQSHSRTSAL